MDERVEIFFMKTESKFLKKFDDSLKTNVKLCNYSWFNLGGNAEYFYKAKDKNQLIEFLKEAKEKKIKLTIIGAGSNTLFRDKGVSGAVIKLGKNFSFTKLEKKNIIIAGGATLDRKVANFAKENSITNLEFLSCIPGSIGGAVVMNSGCYNNDISKVLLSIEAIDLKNLSEIEIKKNDIKFLYRGTNLPKDLIITSAKFQGLIGKKKEIEEKQRNFVERKKLSQPSQVKTCGSTFKNIDKEKKAWMLIKQSGCENFREGDAKISNKHCNFFINEGNAKASDIEKLINNVKKTVFEKTGVNLELEIKIVGD